MNSTRRAILRRIAEQLAELSTAIEGERDAEQEAFDNMHENFQDGERGERAQAAIGLLDDAIAGLEEVGTSLEEACE